jgi:thiosulfate/3-mercaptopyruvate sulfurtransferase
MENVIIFVQQNIMFCISFVLILAIYIGFELTQAKKSKTGLSLSDAVLAVNKNKGLYLDVRDEETYKKAHIIGARNISFDELGTKHQKLVKNKSNPIVVYGDNAEKAMLLLRKEGFEQVYTLKGGLSAWMQASYPVKSI